jgi:DNA-binding transcriptional MerR regulator
MSTELEQAGIFPTISVGDMARRSGVAVSTLHFYETKGLISSTRTEGNQRRYAREMLRRVAFVRVAQRVGIALADIEAALATLPARAAPSRADWAAPVGRLARRPRRAHGAAQETARHAGRLHRLRLPVDRQMPAAQPAGQAWRAGRGTAAFVGQPRKAPTERPPYLEPLTKPSEAVLARRVAADSATARQGDCNNAGRVFERF